MEEDTNKSGTNVPQSYGDGGEMKKVSIKFANNPKVLNMCQLSQDTALRAALPKTTHSFSPSTVSTVSSSSTSQTSKNQTTTSSLLKKLPGNISVSTQRISIQSKQPVTTVALSSASLIPNKPVVVQAINSPAVAPPTGGTGPVRKIVFHPGESRFLKIVNATPETTSSITPEKKVIVQRVEQIQPPHAKNVVVQGQSSPQPQIKQKRVILVSGNKTSSKIIVAGQQTVKKREESYIVNEMPPEMRTKAIVVSSNNPTGDNQVLQKVIRTPVQSKLAPVTITKRLLPIRPKLNLVNEKLATNHRTTDDTTLIRPHYPSSLSGTTFHLITPDQQDLPYILPKQQDAESKIPNKIIIPTTSNTPGEFFGDEKKSSFEKLVEKFPDQVCKVVTKSVGTIPTKSAQVSESRKINTISMGKFDSIFNVHIKDGKLSSPYFDMLGKHTRNAKPSEEGSSSPERKKNEEPLNVDASKSPRLKGRSKSTAAIDPPFIKRYPAAPGRIRSPSLSSILPEFTKQSQRLILEKKEEARRKSQTPDQEEKTENLVDILLCDENMDVSGTGSNESSPEKESQVDDDSQDNEKENSDSNNGNDNDSKYDGENMKDMSNDEKSNNDESSDVEVVGFPDSDLSERMPQESLAPMRKKRRLSNDESDEEIPSVLKVPVHKLFKYQSDRITDDIHLSDPFRHIKWKDGIGSLEDSTIHFKVNQLGVYEVMSNEEYYSLIKHKPDKDLIDPIGTREKRRRKKTKEVMYKCSVCLGVGTVEEFRSPSICSWTCQDLLLPIKKETDDDSNSTSDLDEMSLLDSPVSAMAPSTSASPTKKFKKVDAPSELFQNPFPDAKNLFQIGMKLEAIDPYNQSLFCVCTIEDKRGYRIKLHFDSSPSKYNFWVNADSKNIFPPGWCSATDRTITLPTNYWKTKFDWNTYLKDPKVMAPVQMFPHLKINEGRNDHFKPGMKLEVECPINLSLPGVTAGTIMDIIGRRILIHLDYFDARYDFWTYIDSPAIHPINYHKMKGLKLQTSSEEGFTWSSYLNKTRSTPVPNEAFVPREPIKFQPGMTLEVVDPKNQSLVRPAVVKEVDGHRICILFDSWPSVYAFWVEDEDPNLHPTNWAKHTKHQLEHHRQKPKAGASCSVTKYCRNFGNAVYKSNGWHKLSEECPYFLKNWTKIELSDRLDYNNKKTNNLKKGTSQSQLPQKQKQQQDKSSDKNIGNKPVKTNGDVKIETTALDNVEAHLDNILETPSIISQPLKIDEQVKLGSELLKINSTTLPHNETPPVNWSPLQVSSYIKSIPACEKLGQIFEIQEVDGTAMLSLTKEDLMHQLQIKFGPAVKIYNCILKLREKILIEIVN